MKQLVLIRHGESQWNLENRFTGWVDVPLSPRGVEEARGAGKNYRHVGLTRPLPRFYLAPLRLLKLCWKKLGNPI